MNPTYTTQKPTHLCDINKTYLEKKVNSKTDEQIPNEFKVLSLKLSVTRNIS